MEPGSVPRMAPGVRLREDAARGWIVVAPERVFVPDDIALEVLRLIDGARDVTAIVDALAEKFAAPREEIAGDVGELLDDLVTRGAVRV